MKSKKIYFLIFLKELKNQNFMEPLPMSLFGRFVELPTFATLIRDGELNRVCPLPTMGTLRQAKYGCGRCCDCETCSLMTVRFIGKKPR